MQHNKVNQIFLDAPIARRQIRTIMIPAALRLPIFRRYMAGSFFGLNATWILRIAIGWLAWELSGSAALTGTVAFLTFAPIIFAGPFFGVWADRIDPRKGIIAAQTGQGLFGAILFALALADALSAPVLMAAALGLGVAASAYHPFRMALIPRLATPETLGQAVALGAMNFNTTRMLGPALGGWLIHDYGAAAAVGLAAALFVPQVAVIATLPAFPPAPVDPSIQARGGIRGVFDQVAEGARYAMALPLVREAVLMNALFAVAARGSLELLPVAADGLYDRGAGGFGALTAVAGAGAVVSAVLMTRGHPTPEAMRVRARYATAAGFAATAALGMVASWPAALATVAILGFCGTMVGVSNQTIAQKLTPDGKRGRVMSLWLIAGIGGASIGSIGIGALADIVGLRYALVIAAVAMAALAPLAAWKSRARPAPAEPAAAPGCVTPRASGRNPARR